MKRFRYFLYALAITLLLTGCTQGADQEVVISDFSGGLNNWSDPVMIGDNQSPDCANVYADERGILTTRKGYSKFQDIVLSSWTQTTAEDWNAGSLVNIDTYTASGSYRLKTSYWTQTSASDFASGTLVNIDTTTVSGTFRVAKTTEAVEQEYASGQDDFLYLINYPIAQSFTPSINCIATKIEIYVYEMGSPPASLSLYLKADNNNFPGTTLASATVSGITSSVDWRAADITDTILTANIKYWIYAPPVGDNYNCYRWGADTTSPTYSGGNFWNEPNGNIVSVDCLFKVYEQHYQASSNLISQIGDLGITPSSWGNFVATQDLNGGTIDWYVQTSSSSDMSSPTGWVAVTNNTTPSVTLNRYVQWQADLHPTDTATPVVYDITINGKIIGSLTSQSYNIGTSTGSWERLEVTQTLNNGTITYAVRTSSYSGGLSNSAWYSVVPGEIISAPFNQYVQWISTLTQIGSNSPIVEEVILYYSAGIMISTKELYSLIFADGSNYLMRHYESRIEHITGPEQTWTVLISTLNANYEIDFQTFKNKLIWVNGYDYAGTWDGSTVDTDTSIPKGYSITLHKNRLWVSGESNNKSVIYYSEDSWTGTTYTEWLSNSIEINPDDGDIITGTYSFQDMLIVFKKKSMWVIIGDTPPWSLRQIHSRIGSLYNRSVQVTENGIIWLARDGFYSFDGSTIKKLSKPIQGIVEGIQQIGPIGGIQQGTIYYRNWLLTSQSDFEGGTYDTDALDTASYPGELRLKDHPWLETTTADFTGGVIKDNVTVANNEVKIDLGAGTLDQSQTTYSDSISNIGSNLYRTFVPSEKSILTKVVVYIKNSRPQYSWVNRFLRIQREDYVGGILKEVTITDPGDEFIWKEYTINLLVEAGVTYEIMIQLAAVLPDKTDYTGVISWGRSPAGSSGYMFKTYKQSYQGQFRSKIRDFGTEVIFGKFYEHHLSGGTYQFQVRRYLGGEWSSWYVTGNNSWPSALTTGTSVQYQIFFTFVGTTNPTVYDTEIRSNALQQTYTSVKKDCGSSIGQWGLWEANYSVAPGITTLTFEVKYATSSAALDSTSWSSINPGVQISVSTSTYWTQWRGHFATNAYGSTPILSAITVNWLEGEEGAEAFAFAGPTASLWWKDRYYVFFADLGYDYNNKGLVYDSYGGWLPLTGINVSCATIFKDRPYIGESISGRVHSFDVGYNDALSGIDAYWTSKRITFGAPNNDKVLKYIWLICEPSGYYNVTISYRADGGNWYSENIALGSTGLTGLKKRKLSIPKGIMGNSFDIKISNSNADQPFRVHGLTLQAEILPLK